MNGSEGFNGAQWFNGSSGLNGGAGFNGSVTSVAPVIPQSASRVAHWSADDLSQADSSAVTSWVDSVNSIAATNASSTATFQTNVLGSKPSVRFPGSTNGFLDILTPGALATALDSQTYTMLITFRQLSNTANTYGTLFFYAATVGGAASYHMADNSRLHRYPMIGADANIPFTDLNTFTTFGNTSSTASSVTGSPLERAFVNGGCIYSDTIAAPGGTTSTHQIGGRSDVEFFVNADIFEIVVWGVELTPAEVKQYHAWAANKYAQSTPWASSSSTLAMHGDSIMNGTEIFTAASDRAPWQTAATLGLAFGEWDNLGIGYLTMPQMTSSYEADVHAIAAVTGKPLKVIAFEWYNQRAASPTPYNATLAYIAAVKALGDGLAIGTSTSNGVDDIVGPPSWRDDYDTALIADYGTADVLMNITADANIGARGAYSTYPANFQADTLHLTATGTPYLAALMSTAAAAIP